MKPNLDSCSLCSLSSLFHNLSNGFKIDALIVTIFLFIFVLPAMIKSDTGQDSSSPSTTPHTRGFSSPSTAPQIRPTPSSQGPPTLALAQPQPPRVPPTPTSHAPHLGPPYPLSTPEVLAQGMMTSVPPPALTHPGLHPAPLLQSSPALIKVRRAQQALFYESQTGLSSFFNI